MRNYSFNARCKTENPKKQIKCVEGMSIYWSGGGGGGWMGRAEKPINEVQFQGDSDKIFNLVSECSNAVHMSSPVGERFS